MAKKNVPANDKQEILGKYDVIMYYKEKSNDSKL